MNTKYKKHSTNREDKTQKTKGMGRAGFDFVLLVLWFCRCSRLVKQWFRG